MKKFIYSFCNVFIVVFLYSFIAYAGGPLSTRNGNPVRYNNASAISYKTDLGSMGSFSNAVATNLSINSFQTWQNVSTAQITFTNGGQLPVDITAANFTDYLDNDADGINPIIFDADGSIVDAILGAGSSNKTIGFAGSSQNGGFYTEGRAVMNGKFANNPFTEAQFKSTFVHEFGHFIGLDHSQINANLAGDGNAANDIYLPTMYPTSTDDDVPLGELNPDDIAAVSALYPKATFATTTGRISGNITLYDNSAVLGANVVAISTGADSLLNRISTVSDYYQQNTGNYTVVGLAPGNYYIRIEPIMADFIGGSSVGPYTTSLTDFSFINPVATEYYNAGNESLDPGTDNPAERTSIAVSANATTSNINLVANKIPNVPITKILHYHSGLFGVYALPSRFNDSRYSVRFTPSVDAKFMRVEYYINGGNNAVQGNGTLKVTLHQHTLGSIGGVPGTQIGSPVTIPFSQIKTSTYNLVDFTAQNLQVQAGVDFHVAFEVVGGAGDTVQFVADDGSVPTNRTSSFFNGGWFNFLEPSNYNKGINMAIKVVMDVPSLVRREENVAESFSLRQNFPNPFNPSTMITFSIPKEEIVVLKVYSILGEEVKTLVNESLSAGEYSASFDASQLSSGIYFYTINAGNLTQSKKMMLLK